jgi:hypothetical protein
MAKLRVDGEELVLELSVGEKILGAHGSLKVPLAAVRKWQILDDAHEPADHGFKVGERIPGVSEIGRIYSDGKKMFAAVSHDTPRGLRIEFDGEHFSEWIVGCSDPEAVVRELQLRRPGDA